MFEQPASHGKRDGFKCREDYRDAFGGREGSQVEECGVARVGDRIGVLCDVKALRKNK